MNFCDVVVGAIRLDDSDARTCTRASSKGCGVMLRLPPVLILDEATSSIDTRTEQKVQSAFARLMQGRTSIVVTHRLSTIREADAILVMKDGRIIERGRHEELLRQNGFYVNLYQSQFVIPNQ